MLHALEKEIDSLEAEYQDRMVEQTRSEVISRHLASVASQRDCDVNAGAPGMEEF
jgi:hypothetical protein